MLSKTIRKLEFPKVREMLVNCCSFQLSKDMAEVLLPFATLVEAANAQQETTEAKDILRLYPNLPLGGLRDLRSLLRKLAIGGMLQPSELLDIAGTLRAGRRLKLFLYELPPKYVSLKAMGELIGVFRPLEDKISRCIGEDAEVLDQASVDLGNIRRQIKSLQGRIKDRLEHIIRSSEYQKFLQDPIITLRDERYVVPVKQEYRAQIPGIVHDQSASGATLFIEPLAVVEMDNDLRRFFAREKQELERILRDLTHSVALLLDEISDTLTTLGEIDVIFAKGKLSAQMDAGEPKLNQQGRVNIIKGRHPLIKGKTVPVSINIGYAFDTLVITGPNTGGKTVSLKTIGLFCLMAQAGLHVPAEQDTELSIFDNIFADIGDEQSIEQSLSTFSSHMSNIVEILALVNHSSLVLLDEAGAGTDPTEGSALAMAILQYLQLRGAKTIVTTHYSELKNFAYNNSRVENASVEFDLATLRPTYKLLIGTPGKSNAFEIASRLGLNDEVVSSARGFLSEREVQVSDLLQSLEETQRATASDREAADRLRRELEAVRDNMAEERRLLANKERQIVEKASNEALEIIKQAKVEAEEIIAQLKIAAAEEKVRFHTINDARTRLKRMQQSTSDRLEQNKPLAAGRPIQKVKLGQEVDIPKLKQKGHILSQPSPSGEVMVQVGIMKVNLQLDELRPSLDLPRQTLQTGAAKIGKEKSAAINQELDLRGMTVDEAIYEVDKYLDDAVLSGLEQVCLIHGKGTGALRTALQAYLNSHPHVKSQRLGQHGEGGSGVSVIVLK